MRHLKAATVYALNGHVIVVPRADARLYVSPEEAADALRSFILEGLQRIYEDGGCVDQSSWSGFSIEENITKTIRAYSTEPAE
jgi:hypothetical protein